MKKIFFLILFSSFLLISCEKEMKWINPNDPNADQTEFERICKKSGFECGDIIATYQGASFEINCGECASGYNCIDNFCEDIDECKSPDLNNCPEKSDCHNLEMNVDGKPFECICKENYSGEDCVPDTRTKECVDLPENAVWNTAESITQTWSGEEWLPTASGTYNRETSETECRFKCMENYNWNDKTCEPATQKSQCKGLPKNAVWNSASEITQTWSGSEWLPKTDGTYNETPSEKECRYKCDSDFHREDSACVSNTKKDVKCTGLPEHANWNTAESITQNWNGSKWMPSATGSYNEESSNEECRFKCSEHYDWNGSDKKCDAATQSADCTSKPDNTVWNDGGANGKFTQTWTDSGWTPAGYTSTYNTTAGTCRYKCDSTHTRENGACINQRTANCPDKPGNTVWNDDGADGTFTQNWNSTNGWTPNYTSVYSTTSGICRYKCDSTHTWENNSCINQKTASCSSKPANTVWNDNGANGTYTQNWSSSNGWTPTSYTSSYNTTAGTCRYKCDSTHTRENGSCINQKTANCPDKPENTVWNDNGADGTFTQNWSSSNGWTPAGYSTVYSTTSGVCYYTCDSTHTWENNRCINQKTDNCSPIPENAVWNDNGANGTYTQNWSSSNGWSPLSYTSTYNTTAGICRFKCDSTHTWLNGACINQKTASCSAKPENTVWNDNGADGTFTQNWSSANGWTPTSHSSSYSTTAGVCHYTCAEHYNWNSSTSTCDPEVIQTDCPAKPANTVWNDDGANGKFDQTWNGAGWSPASYTSTYSTTAGICRYQCDSNSTWENGSCIKQKSANCSPKPDNSEWNDNGANGTFTQNWNGTGWEPETYTSSYNANEGVCIFKCITDYHWENSACTYNTKTDVECTGLPTNASWNTASKIKQTWNGSSWTPSSTGVYNETPSNEACRFKCYSNYFYYNSQCLNPCDDADCENFENATGSCSSYAWDQYLCECVDDYYWRGTMQGCNTKKLAFANICTGAVKCFNNSSSTCPSAGGSFYGQDPQYAKLGFCTPKNFTVDDTVANKKTTVDNNLFLEWQQEVSGSEMNWESAVNYCETSTYAGHDNWRLPELHELLSIVDSGKDSPKVDPAYFPNITSNAFWTASSAGSGSTTVFSVNFGTSLHSTISKTSSAYTVCVRSSESPAADTFTVLRRNSDTLVRDNTSRLLWQKTFGTGMNWQNALNYCENLTCGGYDDWRLPNRNELASLVSADRNAPASKFPDMPQQTFWSSTVSSKEEIYSGCDTEYIAYLFGINFSNGNSTTINNSNTASVRCVRTDNCISGVWNGSECGADEYCGDGITQTYETCDEGANNGVYNHCNSECSGQLGCGDGIKNGNETCDDGLNNGKYSFCNSMCTGRGDYCGDAILQPGNETCDDGVLNGEYNHCNSECSGLVGCGDGIKNGNETCDDGVLNGEYNYCNSECSGYVCSEGEVWNGSECMPKCSTADVTPCYDPASRLTWSKKSDNGMSYDAAESYCSGSEMNGYGGYTDWRLPNISELRTLIKNCSGTETGGSCRVVDTGNSSTSCLSYSDCWTESACSSCSAIGGHSKFGETGWFWSSSTNVSSPNSAWCVGFLYGNVHYYGKTDTRYVRCVR